MGVRSRNRRVRMASVRKSDFPDVERTIQMLTAARLERARVKLEAFEKTTDQGVNRLLRSLSLYGYRQPMSRGEPIDHAAEDQVTHNPVRHPRDMVHAQPE
ncbi:hypothetical protein FALCPG4_015856 [Fusarium falciforme]